MNDGVERITRDTPISEWKIQGAIAGQESICKIVPFSSYGETKIQIKFAKAASETPDRDNIKNKELVKHRVVASNLSAKTARSISIALKEVADQVEGK